MNCPLSCWCANTTPYGRWGTSSGQKGLGDFLLDVVFEDAELSRFEAAVNEAGYTVRDGDMHEGAIFDSAGGQIDRFGFDSNDALSCHALHRQTFLSYLLGSGIVTSEPAIGRHAQGGSIDGSSRRPIHKFRRG